MNKVFLVIVFALMLVGIYVLNHEDLHQRVFSDANVSSKIVWFDGTIAKVVPASEPNQDISNINLANRSIDSESGIEFFGFVQTVFLFIIILFLLKDRGIVCHDK